MRKVTLILVAMALVLSLTCGVSAAGATLTVADMPAKANETVYLSVSLNGSLTADAIGVRYSYDPTLLEPLPDSAVWNISGLMSDFDREDSGVWANSQPQTVSGRLFTLAFRLKDGVTLTETNVSCTVVFKSSDGSSTELSASGKVYTVCDHTYGDWTNAGQLDHNRKCTLCGKNQSQAHIWNSGTTTDHPSNPALDIVTYTCTVCGATRSLEVTAEAAPEQPTAPTETTYPTEPAPTLPPAETIPVQTEPVTSPTMPQPSYGKPGTEQTPTGSQHPGGTTQPTAPTQPSHSGSPTEPAPGHNVTDYNQSGSQNPSGNSGQNNTGSSNQSGTNSTAPTTGTSSGGENTQSGVQESTDKSGEVLQMPTQPHSHESSQQAVAVPIPTEHSLLVSPSSEPEQDHDHDHTAETQPVSADTDLSGTYLSSGLALAVAIAAVFGAAGLTIVLIRRIRSDRKKKSK